MTYRWTWEGFPVFEVHSTRYAMVVWPFLWAKEALRLRWRAALSRDFADYMDKITECSLRAGFKRINDPSYAMWE